MPLALAVLLWAGEQTMENVASVWLWTFVLLVMLGVIAGNIRSIALPTLVTVLVPEDRRDKANGLVGMVTGIGFLTTSVISGFLIAWAGMGGVMMFALGFTALAFFHLLIVRLDEKRVSRAAPGAPVEPKRVDIAGTIRVIAGVPGLFALIFFATFNNFLGGIFMALLDAYGLSLVSVQVWGLLFGVLSTAFILSGIVISQKGFGKNPLPHIADGQHHHVVGLLRVHHPALDLAAGRRHVHLDAARAVCRGVRTYDAAKGRSAGASGTRVSASPNRSSKPPRP